MLLNHRNFYVSDVGLFLVLAIPCLNDYVIDLVLSFGNADFYTGSARTSLIIFVGIAGVLGLGFSLLRLRIPDSRDLVLISLLVKIFAGSWLLFGYLQGVSPALLVLAIADFGAAVVLSTALIKQT
ncbi:hypothetical protein [uncultured Zhongshania sp.]|jgi:hypothetical protein|uniref:hypothetical protein n=1 Tax=uncultured Zhongshania sp. TaxID=1642288 RepID=UPI0025DE817A|nr:hypothetical protein [uncultured Zhongshania sp.]